MPHKGVLTGSAELPRQGRGYKWLRNDGRHFAIPRFTHVVERAAASVADERTDSKLVVGDLSAKRGGQLLPHLSHRSGRDVDLPFYVTTLDGAPVESPGFIHFGPDALAWDEVHGRYLRLDVEREWLLIRALLTNPEARIQWIFVGDVVAEVLLAWAEARGEEADLCARAREVMAQPRPGGPHDDHLHVRTACAPTEVSQGCEPSGPPRAWLDAPRPFGLEGNTRELALSLFRPLGPPSPRMSYHAYVGRSR